MGTSQRTLPSSPLSAKRPQSSWSRREAPTSTVMLSPLKKSPPRIRDGEAVEVVVAVLEVNGDMEVMAWILMAMEATVMISMGMEHRWAMEVMEEWVMGEAQEECQMLEAR